MTQHFGDDDGHDDLAALDFSATDQDVAAESVSESDPLDFSVADDGEESDVAALDAYAAAESDDTDTELDAIHSASSDAADEDEEEVGPLFTVTNPPETVSVSALVGGRVHQISLSPKVTGMSESELADEIVVIAGLARQKGLAGEHTYLLENDSLSETMRAIGLDGNEVLRDFMENGIGLPTPEEADAEQAEVFATRYAADHE
ncbi:hypothetical protein AWB92_24290 [Mycobacterium sp. IEC1808]|uniref:hypothetical protein n=1 Tax=Mycobacterium sp. IEC1808 TaxID=1743230 RepID=UPI000A159A51|nr:hypothetical protein [Mycobacterium sp. IEC1808]ORW87347.1 hypothetical protein AWB92_24290 [Mycobacterium sp. IEC1808]